MRQMHLFSVVIAIIVYVKIANTNAKVSFPLPLDVIPSAEDTEFLSDKLTHEFEKLSLESIHGRLLTSEEGCGTTKTPNTKIVGGTPAKQGAYPWIASLGYGYTDEEGSRVSFKCAGSLITSRHILTAAHCITPDLIGVRLGDHEIRSSSDGPHKDVRVIKAVRHPFYSPVETGDGTGDIGILTLAEDVEFSDRIRPVCLPLTKAVTSIPLDQYSPFVAGWGLLSEGGPQSNVLMQLQVPIIDNTRCEAMYRAKSNNQSKFSKAVLCFGNVSGGQGTCHGDSGAPLMLPILEFGRFPTYQIGVVAYGMGCARPNLPGVFTRVSHYIDWIQQTVAEN